MNASRRLLCPQSATPFRIHLNLSRSIRQQQRLRQNHNGPPLPNQQPPSYVPPLPPRPNGPLPKRQRFFTWPVILGSLTAIALGSRLGSAMRSFWPSEPGSSQDLQLNKEFDTSLEHLPLVRQLRREVENGQWEEHTAYQNMDAASKKSLLTGGPLAGSRGIGKQLIFRNKETKELICVLRVGPGVSGWPMITHGGVLATLLDEHMGRVSIMSFDGRPSVTANLDVNYHEKTPANSFICIRAKQSSKPSDHKAYIEGSVERMDGVVTVQATGLFVVPKNVQLAPIDDKF